MRKSVGLIILSLFMLCYSYPSRIFIYPGYYCTYNKKIQPNLNYYQWLHISKDYDVTWFVSSNQWSPCYANFNMVAGMNPKWICQQIKKAKKNTSKVNSKGSSDCSTNQAMRGVLFGLNGLVTPSKYGKEITKDTILFYKTAVHYSEHFIDGTSSTTKYYWVSK